MNTTTTLTVAELASLAFGKESAEAEALGDEMFEEQREQLLACARGKARFVLGDEAAAQLDWQYTGTADLPTDTEQATAGLGEGRSEYLRYRVTDDGDSVTFALVQPCSACGNDRIDEVRSLGHLGALLEAADDAAKTAKAVAA